MEPEDREQAIAVKKIVDLISDDSSVLSWSIKDVNDYIEDQTKKPSQKSDPTECLTLAMCLEYNEGSNDFVNGVVKELRKKGILYEQA